MDNLTHSVVGLGVGALIDRTLPAEPDPDSRRLRSRMLLFIGCLASNFPDLDLVLTGLLEPPLGYLLHHRGHTHTLLAAIGEAALLLALVWLLWPAARRLLRESPTARRGALLAAAAGLLLHIGMDSLNVYGVHPFWPFDPNWFYGDLVFIVEPVFWIGFGVPLAAMVRSRPLRWLWLAVIALVPLGAALLGFLHWASLAGLLGLGLLLAWIQHRNDEHHGETRSERGRTALTAGLAASLAFVGLQALALQQARAIVAAELHRIDAGERLLDTALSAYPANPLCWSFAAVARTGEHGAGSVHLRRGLLSVAPGILPVSHCPARVAGPALEDAPPQIAWQAEDRQPLAVLRAQAAGNCRVNAWLRFARVPSLADGVATDVRWGEPGSRNFSTMPLAEADGKPCPHPVPGWGYPRADLLWGP
ncbi:metal-dependent hydrolase [Massilia sp. LXY-6]|uniref:metal-dependent hydrolase n=1 Tax=Massilia sp. LXY-6 TaxID=3379823 RepID=UPI003EDF83D4